LKKRALKVFTFFAAVVILTSAASYFFINGYIYPLIITSTKRVLNEFTGGETEIGKVELSIFPPGIEMTEITLSIEAKKKSSFQVKIIRAELDPVQALSGTININRISVIEPVIDTFVNALPKRKSGSDTVKDKLQPSFFKANIREINIEQGHIIIRLSEDTFLEMEETSLLTAKTDSGSDTFTINAKKGTLVTKGQKEDFGKVLLEGISGEEEIRISNLALSPEWGTLSASASLGMKPNIHARGKIKGEIPFNTISRYIKKELPFKGQGNLVASFNYRDDKANLKASLAYRKKTAPLKVDASFHFLDKEIKVEKAEISADTLKANAEGSIFPGNKVNLRAKASFINLSTLLYHFISPAPSGSLEVEGQIGGTLLKPELTGKVQAANINYKKYSAQKLKGNLSYAHGRLSLEELSVTGENVTLLAGGGITFPDKGPVESDVKVIIPSCQISDLLVMTGETLPIEGIIQSEIYLGGNEENLNIKGEVTINEGAFWGERADLVKLKGHYLDQTFNMEEFFFNVDQSTIKAKGTIPAEGEMNVNFNAKNIDLATINHIDNKATGIVSLKGKIAGSLSAPIVRGNLTALKVKSNKSPLYANVEGDLYAIIDRTDLYKQMISYSSNKLQLVLNEKKRISLTPFTMKFDEGILSFSRTSFSDRFGSVSLKGSITADGDSDISLKAIARLDGLEEHLKGVEKIKGRVDVDIKIKGKLDKPVMKGSINAQKGMVRFKGFPYDMTDVYGKLNLADNRITVDKVNGILEGSKFTGGGRLLFDGYKPSQVKLFFDVEEVDLTFPRWLPSRSKGRMTVSAIGEDVTLGGDIEVLRASYTDKVEFKNFLAKIIKITDTKKVDKEKRKKADEDDLNVKIRFRADDNLIIKNNLGNIELKGDLILTGKGSDLSIIGNLETIGGKGYFRNKEFIIRKGTVDFTSREKIVPVVNIDADTSIKDYQVDVNLSGPPKNLVFTLNSDPPLEEKEIVSLITFGYTGSELRGQGTELTSLGAASLILQEDIEAKIKQYFGFDRLKIEPYYSETADTTEARITLDKNISKNTTATYSRGMSTLDEEVKVEYKLDDNLSLEGSWASTEETVGSFGGDVILRFEFE